ncbi:hypothetical protein [Promicromonospora sp. NPDC090134]|uniref:hypothetical protein n=1 Tax=Promicromonospora sp. NPDC090134 TaxID=3364408 RepID=UPI003823E646
MSELTNDQDKNDQNGPVQDAPGGTGTPDRWAPGQDRGANRNGTAGALPNALGIGAPVLGLGIGMAFGQPAIGVLIGAGVGMVLRALAGRDRG